MKRRKSAAIRTLESLNFLIFVVYSFPASGQEPLYLANFREDPTYGLLYCDDRDLNINHLQPEWNDLTVRPLRTQWFLANKKARFVAITLHGLNLHPQKMLSITKALQEAGGDVLQLALPGYRHRDRDELLDPYLAWAGHLRASLCVAKARAHMGGLPTFFVGYSLGAALYEEILAQKTEDTYRVDAAILFAPALALRFYAYFLKIFFVLGDDFALSSWTPKSYRVKRGISMKSYRGLFRLVNQLHTNASQELNLPTLVFIDPKDEMVSPSGIKDFIETQKLSRWKLRTITKHSSKMKRKFHHLIVNPESLGSATWTIIRQEMIDFLFESVGWKPVEEKSDEQTHSLQTE